MDAQCTCNRRVPVIPEKTLELLRRYKVPFLCKGCGGLRFPYQALNGVVFIWPLPVAEKTVGGVHLPKPIQENFKTAKGVVLSTGEGVLSEKTGAFTKSDLKPGDEVLYDKTVPWQTEAEDEEGGRHLITINNLFDVTARVL